MESVTLLKANNYPAHKLLIEALYYFDEGCKSHNYEIVAKAEIMLQSYKEMLNCFGYEIEYNFMDMRYKKPSSYVGGLRYE